MRRFSSLHTRSLCSSKVPSCFLCAPFTALLRIQLACLLQKLVDLQSLALITWRLSKDALEALVDSHFKSVHDGATAHVNDDWTRSYILLQHAASLGIESVTPISAAIGLSLRRGRRQVSARSRNAALKQLKKLQHQQGFITLQHVEDFEASAAYKTALSTLINELAGDAAVQLVSSIVNARSVSQAVQATGGRRDGCVSELALRKLLRSFKKCL